MAIAELTAIATIAKTAYDIAKDIDKITTSTEEKKKIAELVDILFGVQKNAFEAQEKAQELQTKNHELEKRLREFDEWAETQKQYELKELDSGIFAYARKEDAKSDEPMHHLCPNCFDREKRKSILQGENHWCPACKFLIYPND